MATAIVLEDNEVANQIEKAARCEDALDNHLEFWKVSVGKAFARDRAPGLEPLPPSAKCANACIDPVGCNQYGVERKARRNFCLVCLELLEGRPDRRVL